MKSLLGRALIGLGGFLFIAGVVMRRTIPRDEIPNATYIGIYAIAAVLLGIGYVVNRRP